MLQKEINHILWLTHQLLYLIKVFLTLNLSPVKLYERGFMAANLMYWTEKTRTENTLKLWQEGSNIEHQWFNLESANYSTTTCVSNTQSAQNLNCSTHRDSPSSEPKHLSPKLSYFCMGGTTEQSLTCLEPSAFGGVWHNWNQFRDGWLTLGPAHLTYWFGVCRSCVYFGVSFRGTYLEREQTCYFIGGSRHRDCGWLMQ